MRYSMPILFAAAMALGLAAPTLGQVINEELKLLPNDGAEDDLFGRSIAVDNGIVAVGSYSDSLGFESGSVYLFDAYTGEQKAKLLANDGADDDLFGRSIALDNGFAAFGAPGDDDNGSNSGSAYLFDLSNGTQILKLLPSDGAGNDRFGKAIALHNGIVVVGAIYDGDNGDFSGSAYVFDASTGKQIAKLLPSDGAPKDYFGFSVAIENGIVAVGATGDDDNDYDSGSVYLFDAHTGEQIAKLLPDDGAVYDRFGISIAIDNGIVAIGASQDDKSSSGFVYLFDVSNGDQIRKLVPSDGGDFDGFGRSVAIDNGVVAIGASTRADNGYESGAAYCFEVSSGEQFAKLLPSDGAMSDEFGWAIGLDNGIVGVGAYKDDDNGSKSGSAYLFDASSTPSCIDLTVDNLEAGEEAEFLITRGTPGAKAVTVYGTKPGHTIVYHYAGYCANFGIKGVYQQKVFGGFDRVFDANGEITFNLSIPGNLSGFQVLFQSAQHGTCPDECMSNLIEMVVE